MDPFKSRDKIPRTPPGQSFVNRSLVTGTEAGLKCFTYELDSRSFADWTPEKHTLTLRNSGTACIRERDKPTCVPEVRKLGSDLTSRTPSPPPTVIRRPKASKRRREVEYSSFICLEPDMASTPGPGDSSGRKERTTSNTEDKPIAARLRSRKKLSQQPMNN
ncbi:unnamed protein product [Trichobilharzia szidati]|nr:unnamed protein product [Trichobilharzia szidati]CAH8821636.1 unnamed protein product [Trichobilharzia szidati]